MTGDAAANNCDTLFRSFLQSREEDRAQRDLAGLVDNCLTPVIEVFLRRKFNHLGGKADQADKQDREELQRDIVVRMISALQNVRTCPTANRINYWRSYTLQTATSAFSKYLAARYPRRFSVQNKLRYLFDKTQGLAIWCDDTHEWCVGFDSWRGKRKATETDKRRQELLDHPHEVCRRILPQDEVKTINPRRLVAALLEWCGQPLALDDLIHVYAVLYDLQDSPPVELNADILQPTASADEVAMALENSEGQSLLWQAIRQLQPRACAALLLHARDDSGNCVLELLLMEGIAPLSEMAQAMGMDESQLRTLWGELPLNDSRIAPLLGVQPNRVAQLRMMACRQLKEHLPNRKR